MVVTFVGMGSLYHSPPVWRSLPSGAIIADAVNHRSKGQQHPPMGHLIPLHPGPLGCVLEMPFVSGQEQRSPVAHPPPHSGEQFGRAVQLV